MGATADLHLPLLPKSGFPFDLTSLSVMVTILPLPLLFLLKDRVPSRCQAWSKDTETPVSLLGRNSPGQGQHHGLLGQPGPASHRKSPARYKPAFPQGHSGTLRLQQCRHRPRRLGSG